MTIFEGEMAVSAKSQLFRAEWAGFAKHFGGALGWQAPGAAHPHWQFDALTEIERDASKRKLAEQIANELSLDEPPLEEFGENSFSGAMKPPSWTRMHFAAAAKWHEFAWAGNAADVTAHAHAPTNSKEIQRWLIAVICYVKSELARHHA